MNLSGLFGYGNKSGERRSVEAVRSGSAVSPSGAESGNRHAAAVKSFTPGESIHGEVVSKNGNEVQIRLDKDLVISARLEKDLNITPGQSMTFEVKNSSGSQVALRPLYENLAKDPNVLRALEAARLPATETLMRMVSSMMEQGLSIDRNSVLSMSRLLTAHPDASPETLVALKNLEFPVTPENIEQFEAYKNYEHQLLHGVKDILSALPETFQQMVQNGQTDGAVNLYLQVLQLITAGTLSAKEGTVAGEVSGHLPPAGQTGAGAENAGAVQAQVADVGKDASGTLDVSALFTDRPEAKEQLENLTNPRMSAASGELESGGQTGAPEEGGNRPTELLLQEGDAAQASGSLTFAGNTVSGLLSWKGMDTLYHLLQEAGISRGQLQALRQGTLSTERLLSEIAAKLLESGENGNSAAMKNLLGSKEFGQLLDHEILHQWLLKPQDVGNKNRVEEFYARLREQTARLTEALGPVARDTSLGKSLTNVQNNIDFMNQLNQLYQYVQLPLKMADGEAHGDLYVYTSRKGRTSQDGSVSALLHLDMEHLGPLDVYVTMREQQVGTRFYLKDEKILDFINDRIGQLDERLTKRGYSMKSEMFVNGETDAREKPENLLDTLTGGGNKEPRGGGEMRAFDVRA